MAFDLTRNIVNAASGEITDAAREKLSDFANGLPNPSDFRFPGSARDAVEGFLGTTSGGSADSSYNSTVDERLFKVVPRSGAKVFNNGENSNLSLNSDYQDRGPIASLRLLANPEVTRITTAFGIDVTEDLDQLTNSYNDGYGGQFKNFFLTGVNASYDEKVQVMTTFGDNFVTYYFGKQPVLFQVSGILFDTLDQNWFTKFFTLYETALRGTRLAQNFELLELYLPNLKLTGTINALQHSQDSSNDSVVQFSLQFLAKYVEPLPMPKIGGAMSYEQLDGSFINFNVGKDGASGEGFGVVLRDLKGRIEESVGSIGGIVNSTNKLGQLQSSIFSPVYGIISSITKVVKDVTGDISSLIREFNAPTNAILRDIQNISSQALSLAYLIESSVNSLVKIPERNFANFENTVRSLKNTAGVISRVPETVSQNLKRLKKLGRVKQGSAVLSGGSSRVTSKTPLLNSGKPYDPKDGYRIS